MIILLGKKVKNKKVYVVIKSFYRLQKEDRIWGLDMGGIDKQN